MLSTPKRHMSLAWRWSTFILLAAIVSMRFLTRSIGKKRRPESIMSPRQLRPQQQRAELARAELARAELARAKLARGTYAYCGASVMETEEWRTPPDSSSRTARGLWVQARWKNAVPGWAGAAS